MTDVLGTASTTNTRNQACVTFMSDRRRHEQMELSTHGLRVFYFNPHPSEELTFVFKFADTIDVTSTSVLLYWENKWCFKGTL